MSEMRRGGPGSRGAAGAVVVVGGGMAGCAAAAAAAQAGAEVTLVERAPVLTGSALRAGHIGTNAQFLIMEELKALGAGALFEALESIIRHRGDVSLPGDEGTMIYDCGLVDVVVGRTLAALGVDVVVGSRVVAAIEDDGRIAVVRLDDGREVEGDVFIDATGSSGGVEVCEAYGKGCVECLFRCPEYGDRVSLVAITGVSERAKVRDGGKPGAIGAGVSVAKDSVDPELLARLEREGKLTIPLPEALVDERKAQQQEAGRTREQMRYLNLSDIGPAVKCVGLSYLPLEQLRTVAGLERVRYEYPARAGDFNRIVMVAVAPWEAGFRVTGSRNLFCAGEKTGVHGIVAVMLTGALAGHNAVRSLLGEPPLVLPPTIGSGAYLEYVSERIGRPDGPQHKFSLSNSPAVDHLKELGLYGFEPGAIRRRVAEAGLEGALAAPAA